MTKIIRYTFLLPPWWRLPSAAHFLLIVLFTSINCLIVAFLILDLMLRTTPISGLDWLQTHSNWPTVCPNISFMSFGSGSDKLCLKWRLILTHSKFFIYSFWSIVILSSWKQRFKPNYLIFLLFPVPIANVFRKMKCDLEFFITCNEEIIKHVQ